MPDEKKKEEEDLKIVTDDPKDLEESAQDLPPEGEGKKAAAEEAEEDAEDERLGHDEDDDDEGRPRDRKSERASRKQRQREARERQAREIGFLRKELDRVDRDNVEMRKRLMGQESRSYDRQLTEVDRNIREAEDIMKAALAAKNGDDHTEALRIRDQLLESKRKLLEEKEEHEEAAKAEPRRQQQGPDPEVVSRGRNWMNNNPWFKTDQRGRPQGQDSRIARAIDESVVEDGFDPRTDEYWEEFDKRVKQQLPHLAKKGKARDEDRHGRDEDDEEEGDERPQRREKRQPKGPKFRVGGRERALGKNEVYLPKERIEALKEAGIWDDPVERARYLKAYKSYDEQNATN